MLEFRERLDASGVIVTETALHVGSGGSGRGASDNGIVLTVRGEPFIPGSSLKGVFRATAERFAEALGLGACHLEAGRGCASGDPNVRKQADEELQKAAGSEVDGIVEKHTCFACRIFGSPLAASRVSFADAAVMEWAGATEVRDCVCLDRDGRTAARGLKFDVEVVPAGARFRFRMQGHNLDERQKALLFAVLFEWRRGFHIGGLTSRGLGAARLEDLRVEELDLDRNGRAALIGYLVGGKAAVVDEAAMRHAIESELAGQGGAR